MFIFFFFLRIRRPPRSTRTYTLFPYTTLFRSHHLGQLPAYAGHLPSAVGAPARPAAAAGLYRQYRARRGDRRERPGAQTAQGRDRRRRPRRLRARTGGEPQAAGTRERAAAAAYGLGHPGRSEEHTSELQSLLLLTYAILSLH